MAIASGAVGEDGGSEFIGRLVDEVASEILGFAEEDAAVESGG